MGPTARGSEPTAAVVTPAAPARINFTVRVEAQTLDDAWPLANHPVVVGNDTAMTNASGIATIAIASSELGAPRDVFVPGSAEFFPARVRALASGGIIRLLPKTIRVPECSQAFGGQSAPLRIAEAATGPSYNDGGSTMYPHNLAYFRNYEFQDRTRNFFNPRWAVSRIPFAFSPAGPAGPAFTDSQKEQIRSEVGALLGNGICDTFYEVPFVGADQYGLVIQAVDALPQGGAGMLEHLVVDEKTGAILNAFVSIRVMTNGTSTWIKTRTPAHEAAHALGVGHTDQWTSLMSSGPNASAADAPTLADAAHYFAFKSFSRGGALVNAMNALDPEWNWQPFWDTRESVAAATAAAASYGRAAAASDMPAVSLDTFMAKSTRTGVAKISMREEAH